MCRAIELSQGPSMVTGLIDQQLLTMKWGHHMFLSASLEQLDPALLAFVKCHITSPLKWEALRVLAEHNGVWLDTARLARAAHRTPTEITPTLAGLVAEGIVEELDGTYRLPPDEPTSV